jgi:hypothetical protein
MKARYGFVMLTTALLISLPAENALACSCIEPPPDEVALRQSDAAFAGTPVAHDDPEGGGKIISSGRPIIWTFQVDAVAKGDIVSQWEVVSAADGASCGYQFSEGKRYLVFAYYGDGFERVQDPDADLHTNICTNTRPLGANEELPFPADEVNMPDGVLRVDDDSSIVTLLLSLLVVGAVSASVIYLFGRRA